jgi:hypothetical protein
LIRIERESQAAEAAKHRTQAVELSRAKSEIRIAMKSGELQNVKRLVRQTKSLAETCCQEGNIMDALNLREYDLLVKAYWWQYRNNHIVKI